MTPNRFFAQKSNQSANILTYLRIAAIPVIVVLLAPPTSKQSLNLAFFLYLLASTTDYLDGILARSSQPGHSVGKCLDPLADKLLTFSRAHYADTFGGRSRPAGFSHSGREIIITGLHPLPPVRLDPRCQPHGQAQDGLGSPFAIGFLLLSVRMWKPRCIPSHGVLVDFAGVELLVCGDYFPRLSP